MKTKAIMALLALLCFGCKQGQQSSTKIEENTTVIADTSVLTTAQKIAEASGFSQWKDVSEISFTFNVERGGNHFERTWTWGPKTDAVSMTSAKDTVAYNRATMDSLQQKTDAAFINDKYWLLAPFQLVWDKDITFSEKEKAVAPISKDTLSQLTIAYPDQGGYTPGDAYDFFYDENFKIREWNYRKADTPQPTMTTTWQDYKNFNGLDIATKHQDSTGSFKLYFTNISVKKQGMH